MTLRFVFLTQQQRVNCVDVFISMRSASAAARTPVDCSELHQQPVDAVLRPTSVQNFVINCRALQPLHSYRFLIKVLSPLLNSVKSFRVCFITASKFALFSVSGLKDETFIKKSKPELSSYTVSKLGRFWDTFDINIVRCSQLR